MEKIYKPDNSFDFSKMVLLTPNIISGGNFFIKFKMEEEPIYIELPKCKTRQGIFKTGKKYSCDLLFSNENETFIQWMDNLETICKKRLFENRDKWFENGIEEEDLENLFVSPLKIHKSIKNYMLKTNVPTSQNSTCSLKVYNENREEINIETIDENTTVLSILEIQGIKCSSRNFQVEMEIKQMMTINPLNLFQNCVFPVKPAEKPAVDDSLKQIAAATPPPPHHHNSILHRFLHRNPQPLHKKYMK